MSEKNDQNPWPAADSGTPAQDGSDAAAFPVPTPPAAPADPYTPADPFAAAPAEETPQAAPAFPAPESHPAAPAYQPAPPAQPGYEPAPYGQAPQQPYAAPAYPQAGYPQGQGYGQPYAVPAKTNLFAILAIIAAFVFAPVGIVFGHISLNQLKTSGESGEGLAKAGLILSYIFTGLMVLYILFVIIMVIVFAGAGAASSYSSL